MGLSGNDGKIIREAIEVFGKNIKRDMTENSPFDRTKTGRISKVTATGYEVEIENNLYPNIKAVDSSPLYENDIVVCGVPNNQMSQIYIIGRLCEKSDRAINNGTLTILENGVSRGTFSANQESDSSINLSVSNPNLLINSNFAINQRGEPSYSTNNKYTVDRWQISGSLSLLVNNDGTITLTSSSSTTGFMFQKIEETNKLWGRTVTVSAEFADGTIITKSGTLPTTPPLTSSSLLNSGKINNAGLRLYYYTSNQCMAFTFDIYSGTTKTPLWAKLEIGDVATAYVPPLRAEELPKCQRYYQPLKLQGQCMSASSATTFYPVAKLLVQMRVKPLITVDTMPYVRGCIQSLSAINVIASSITINTFYADCLQLQVTLGSSSMTQNYIYALANGYATLDAEIY